MERDLVRYLLTIRELTRLVSTRILPSKLPTDTVKPAIVYKKNSFKNVNWIRSKGKIKEKYSLFIIADGYQTAKRLESILVDRLDFYEGRLGTINNVSVRVLNANDISSEIVEVVIEITNIN